MTKARLLSLLLTRFERHPQRVPGIDRATLEARLDAASPDRLGSLGWMEETGGEPDVFGLDPAGGDLLFCDCSTESPGGRRSLCYDESALAARKANKPRGSALGMAAAAGVELLDEARYRALQQLGEFDLKTSSWIATPPDVRARGGALFGDRRYGRVFTYHNGAESYYAARGFRALLRV